MSTKDNHPATRSTRSTRQILKGSNHILQSLYAQSRETKSVEAVVARYIDGEFEVSSFKNNELTLICPSGATATKLRYRQRNILTTLKRAGMDIENIKIKVQPMTELVPKKQVERTLSEQGASQLRATASDIADAPLRDALIKLSKRSRNDTDGN